MKIISLGWGVQSFALAAMSALGVLPPVDVAVHADTGHERAETYAFAEKWTPWLEERGVRVVTVRPSPHLTDIVNGNRFVTPPFFTSGPQGSGMLYRTCTDRWKIRPMQKWQREELERRGLKKSAGIIEKWIGITFDEAKRAKPSRIKYITNVYPFIEVFDSPWTRRKVIEWLTENGLEIPPKSSCIICPFHDRATWREIQLSSNGDWERALEVDRAIRNKRPGYLCYLTAQRKPLDECDFRSQEEHGQLNLWGQERQEGTR